MKEFFRQTQEGMNKTPLFSKSLGIILFIFFVFMITIFLFVNVIKDTQSRVTSIRIDSLQSGLIEFLPDALLNREYTLDRLVSFASKDPSIGNIRVVEFVDNQPIVTISFDENEIGKVADGFSSLISLATTEPGKSFTVVNQTNEGDILLTAKTFSSQNSSGVLVITHIPSKDTVLIDTNLSFVVMIIMTLVFFVIIVLVWYTKIFSQFSIFNGMKDVEAEKNDFLKIISRTLKDPILSIREYVGDLSIVVAGNENAMRLLSKIDNLNEETSHFIEDMLEATRLRQEAIDFSFEILNPVILLNDIVSAFSNIAEERKIEILKDFPTKENVSIDQFKLKQNILHILNFISGRVDKGGKIELSTSVKMESLIIKIHDSGGPISQKEQNKMFNKFFGQDENTLRNIGSTQVQLWIAYESIRQMGGMLSVTSDKEGVVFSINFPVQ